MTFRALLAPLLTALLLSGCTSTTNPTPATPAQVQLQIANLRQLLLEANGVTQVLAATGVLTPAEQLLANQAYASAVAALNEASSEAAQGQSISLIDVALAGATGYLQQISQAHNTARMRRTSPATQAAGK